MSALKDDGLWSVLLPFHWINTEVSIERIISRADFRSRDDHLCISSDNEECHGISTVFSYAAPVA